MYPRTNCLYLLLRYLHEDVAVHVAVLDGVVGADALGGVDVVGLGVGVGLGLGVGTWRC